MSYNSQSVFRDIYFDNEAVGLDTENSAYWLVDGCVFTGAQMLIGISISNTNNPDAGYSSIAHSTFIVPPGGTSSNAIIQYSSGGLTISDSKFNGWTWAYQLYLGSGVATAARTGSHCRRRRTSW